MPAIADLITAAERDRLALRLRELRELDELMRETGGMAPAPVPPPLHRAAQGEAAR
jgi:hypothetical protein